MPGRTKALCIMALGFIGCGGSALALSGGSFTPPGGQAPATAPGGTQGLAGPRNVSDAIRSGQAVEVPPGAGGTARHHRRSRQRVPHGD